MESYFFSFADCDCGTRMLILDSERGAPMSSLKIWRLRREAKKGNRIFIDNRVTKRCPGPGCGKEIDLTKPDEHERWVDGELIRQSGV